MLNARYQPAAPTVKPDDVALISPFALGRNKAFAAWVERIDEKSRRKLALDADDEKARELQSAYMAYLRIRSGLTFNFVPLAFDQDQTEHWLNPNHILCPNYLKGVAYVGDSTKLPAIREAFLGARKGLIENDPAEFNKQTKLLVASIDQAVAAAKEKHPKTCYPSAADVARELSLNRSAPFLKTAYAAFAAAIAFLAAIGLKELATRRSIDRDELTGDRSIETGESKGATYLARFGYLALFAGMAMMIYGMYLRVMISGRPPVTNLYETLIWSSFAVAVVATVIGLTHRSTLVPFVGAVMLGLMTMFSSMIPVHYGASIEPLTAVLRTRYWLIIHVMTIVFSYGAAVLSFGIGLTAMTMYLFGLDRRETMKSLAHFSYRSIQVATLLLGAGTILGGVWAADSWGRFWGWDPKEIGALVAFLCYVIVLHARFVGLLKTFGMLAWSVLGFGGVAFAWYGVNFVLPVGLHSYGFGKGGVEYFAAATVAVLAFVALTASVHFARESRRSAARTAGGAGRVGTDLAVDASTGESRTLSAGV
jgi:ABC-type transport system involved in cytochrome c biogenesis permease subunit